MPRERPSNAARGSKRTNDPSTSGSGAPKVKKKYEDPLKKMTFVDPLKQKIEPYKSDFKIPEYQPYTSYQEYILPDLDPLTGKPWRKRQPPKPKQETQKEKKQDKPNKVEKKSERFPKEVGSSVESMKRSLRIMENLNF